MGEIGSNAGRFGTCEDQGGEESGFAIYRVQDAVLSHLSESSTPLRTREIVEEICNKAETDRRTVERALSRLAQAGKVQKPKQGYYEIGRISDSDTPTTTRN